MNDYKISDTFTRKTTTSTLHRLINHITTGFSFITINLEENILQEKLKEETFKNKQSILESIIKILPKSITKKPAKPEENKDLNELEKTLSINYINTNNLY